MRRAGTVVRLAQGLIVVRAAGSDHADIGASLVDETLADVGRVVDVFGPVEAPYLAVTTDSDVHPPTLLGEPLYLR
ncbi:H/ACA ribonucleoprotein complex subunit GAR1 [Halanaeroarchaeum sulfurireducens]|uniref:H/ACA RNA-protein complex component Gar1 n=1 Tax=Halanaeroarchaeum sulfurireducens TaxID=1604004 RepID=A0A0F7P9D5_9EURY|nr:Gar1/Naf1 family protein [Halanaeroarchaeum sulfurireducens]AKH97741.1 H/ACA RNA-protein complex component Gar1 [Halanaeroarchaeum sulfurireducens]ALG82136.1 H/ACA RNA-protein complex component Gar1 [Halanaeroarchaeum sulfurireducens]